MAYTPTEWMTGDTITAEKLNNMEQGIAQSGSADHPVIVANVTATKNGNDYDCVSDTTFADLVDAWNNGKLPMVRLTINPNDGRPESYYERKCCVLRNYITNNYFDFGAIETNTTLDITTLYTIGFSSNDSISLGITP